MRSSAIALPVLAAGAAAQSSITSSVQRRERTCEIAIKAVQYSTVMYVQVSPDARYPGTGPHSGPSVFCSHIFRPVVDMLTFCSHFRIRAPASGKDRCGVGHAVYRFVSAVN
ncbi:hypothetical protein BU25DRAFT_449932 [Macroventuria anomochaeta]|uniref:Uncharacterized protein n=1 Tax=Macroventuria anomochaeta TaxID=301207 RepID=A0ACB6RX51_9PLEO|nr:uncharacterized protein BU25DRAFT_449932 [Macroventuria anomochaeta]KAF2625509.1 hypothetical protein BU25DRAFT_449932 [Macroventuria anomochaeta]